MNISKKLFGTVLGAIVAGSIGGTSVAAMQIFGFTLLVVLPGILSIVGLFALVARQVVHRKLYKVMRARTRSNLIALISACAIADGVFAAAFAIAPALWWVWVICLIVLAAVEYMAFKGFDFAVSTLPTAEQIKVEKQERAVRQQAARQAAQRPPEVRKLIKALRKSKLEWLDYQAYEYVNTTDVKYTVVVPSAWTLEQSGDGKKTAHAIGPQTAEALAIAFSEVLQEAENAQAAREQRPPRNVRLESSWVSVQKEKGAGVYSITVNTQDVMQKLVPYEEDLDNVEPASIYEPAPIGVGPDGALVYLLLAQHGNAVGQTQSGKSSFINVVIAYITRCYDALLWVGGTHKLYESIGPFLERYRGTTGMKSPFDRLAFGGQDVANMLVDCLRLSDFRQSTPLKLRPKRWKAVVCLIDEAHAVAEVEKWAKYLGKKYTPAKLFSLIIKMTASAGVYLLLANQRGTIENYGDKGGDVIANMGYTAAFRTRDFQELGRQMNDYKLPTPVHQGEGWLNPGLTVNVRSGDTEPDDGLPKHFKCFYLQQEIAERLHDGPTDADIGWARRDLVHELDPREAHALGEGYLTRAKTADEQLAYLEQMFATVYDESQGEDKSAAQSDGEEAVLAWMQEAWGVAPKEPAADERPPEPAPAPETTGTGGTLRDRVLDILIAADGDPLGPKAIALRLSAQGIKTQTGKQVSTQQVQNMLGELAELEEATNLGRGQWVAATATEGATA